MPDALSALQMVSSPLGALYIPTSFGTLCGYLLDRALTNNSARFRLWAYLGLPAALMALQPIALAQTTTFAVRNIDHLLAQWDDDWFGSPALVWSRIIWGHGWRMVAVSIWYSSLAAMMPIGVALARRSIVPFGAYATFGVSSIALYWMFPALGPAHSLGGFPWAGEVWATAPQGVCNAFPSMHTAAVMVVVFSAPRRLMPLWAIYGVGMVFCCVANGQHWLVDCIAGTVLAFLAVMAGELALSRHHAGVARAALAEATVSPEP